MNKLNIRTSKFLYLIKPFSKKLILVLLLSIISLIFEMLSLGIFVPIINIIQSPEGLNGVPYLNDIYPGILSFDKFQLILFFVMLVFLIYLIKFLINIFISIYHAILASKIDTYLSVKIFKSIINKPYEFHSNKNTSNFISTIINEVHQFSELIKYVLIFTTELLVSAGIFIVLIIYNPLSTFIILAFSIFFFLLLRRITRHRLIFWGNQRQIFQDLMHKNLKEGFNSIIYIKLKKIENYFINSFKNSIESRNIFTTRQYAFSNMPRQLLELASIFLLGLIVYINISVVNLKFETLVLMLTFYVIALSRILPSINRIITSYNFILYSDVVIDRVYDEALDNFNQTRASINDEEPIKFKISIELKNIHFKYKNSKKKVLNNINFLINKNDILGLSGGSGTGKTTLVNLLLGLLDPNEGEILIDGKAINNISAFQSIVGYVPQNCLILDDSLVNNIVFGQNINIIDTKRVEYCIKASGLSNFLKTLDNGLETNLGEDGSKISGGQKQRIGLARALYSNPEVIVLDEATNALDKKTEIEILKTIKKLGERTTIIIISHDEKTLEICNRRFNLDTYL